MKRRFAYLLGFLVSAACSGVNADEGPRPGYSFFGLGYDLLDYEENATARIAGEAVDIETDTSANLTQQSGGYVPIDGEWGFYIASASTLGESTSSEEWVIGETVIRTNKVSFDRQRLGVLASYRLSVSHYLLFGTQYGSTEFKRFAAELTPAATDFGIDEDTFTSGTVSEKVWSLSAVVGHEVNTFFLPWDRRWRIHLQTMLGVPLITSITNTDVNDGASVRENFNGVEFRFGAALGYQWRRNFTAAAALELGYSLREAVSGDFIDGEGNATELPENRVIYLYPSLVLDWSF